MINFETEYVLDKNYISFLETNESQITIPIRDKSGNLISGIMSYAIVGQDFKTVIIPKEIEDIEENAFFDCPNLEEVYLNNIVTNKVNLDKCFIKDSNNILFIVGSTISKKDFHSDKYIIIRNSNVFFSPYTKYEEDSNNCYYIIHDVIDGGSCPGSGADFCSQDQKRDKKTGACSKGFPHAPHERL